MTAYLIVLRMTCPVMLDSSPVTMPERTASGNGFDGSCTSGRSPSLHAELGVRAAVRAGLDPARREFAPHLLARGALRSLARHVAVAPVGIDRGPAVEALLDQPVRGWRAGLFAAESLSLVLLFLGNPLVGAREIPHLYAP